MTANATAPTIATVANDTRHTSWLATSTSASRLINPGSANWSVMAYARRRWATWARHSAWRVCTTMSHRPRSVKLNGAKAW